QFCMAEYCSDRDNKGSRRYRSADRSRCAGRRDLFSSTRRAGEPVSAQTPISADRPRWRLTRELQGQTGSPGSRSAGNISSRGGRLTCAHQAHLAYPPAPLRAKFGKVFPVLHRPSAHVGALIEIKGCPEFLQYACGRLANVRFGSQADNNRPQVAESGCPLYPQKRAIGRSLGKSALCQEQTSSSSADHSALILAALMNGHHLSTSAL